jgi:short-subunit dehydrogenase
MPTALITGGNSGIGLQFARRLAAEGYDLVLVARDQARLEFAADELNKQFGVDVTCMPADLGKSPACKRVEARLRNPDCPIDLLINNAGFGIYVDDFAEHDVDDEDQLLSVNVRAVMRLTHAALPPMIARGQGDIINVSSLASFAPDPLSPTYAASKAWVTTFSQGLREQLSGTGVRLLVLTPGLVHTEFQQRAGVDATAPGVLWLPVADVVDTALKDLRAGHGVSTPGMPYRALALAMRLTPRSLYLPLSGSLQRRFTRD